MPKNVEFTTNNMEPMEHLREIANDELTPKKKKVSEHNDLYYVDEEDGLEYEGSPETLNEF